MKTIFSLFSKIPSSDVNKYIQKALLIERGLCSGQDYKKLGGKEVTFSQTPSSL